MKEDLLKIDIIKQYLKERKIDWTKHCLNRLSKRNILIADVKYILMSGTIIEYYYDDYPYPSCLIKGCSIDFKILHVVCGISDGLIHVITAYYPDVNRWEEDMKTRRKE